MLSVIGENFSRERQNLHKKGVKRALFHVYHVLRERKSNILITEVTVPLQSCFTKLAQR